MFKQLYQLPAPGHVGKSAYSICIEGNAAMMCIIVAGTGYSGVVELLVQATANDNTNYDEAQRFYDYCDLFNDDPSWFEAGFVFIGEAGNGQIHENTADG
jgi:hypothetical protein